NEFYRAGLFIAHDPRRFVDFLEPLDVPPLDAGLAASIVESAPSDASRARSGLAQLQREARAAFGGFFGDGRGLALIRSPRSAGASGRGDPMDAGRRWLGAGARCTRLEPNALASQHPVPEPRLGGPRTVTLMASRRFRAERRLMTVDEAMRRQRCRTIAGRLPA